MKRMRAKYLLVLLPAVTVFLAIVCALLIWRPAAPYSKDWVTVSSPSFTARTNAGAATPVVTFVVSNVSPLSVEFSVRWFESRDKSNRSLLATNQLRAVYMALRSGESTNLATDVSLVGMPTQDCLCCCQICWSQRESAWRRHARFLDEPVRSLFDLSDRDWPPWRPQHLASGDVFAANLEVADYFRYVYGFTRAQWLEDLSQLTALRTQATVQVPRFASLLPNRLTDEEVRAQEARDAFIAFCQASVNSRRDAEPTAPPNAVQPHR
jgi:hypothetical protein